MPSMTLCNILYIYLALTLASYIHQPSKIFGGPLEHTK